MFGKNANLCYMLQFSVDIALVTEGLTHTHITFILNERLAAMEQIKWLDEWHWLKFASMETHKVEPLFQIKRKTSLVTAYECGSHQHRYRIERWRQITCCRQTLNLLTFKARYCSPILTKVFCFLSVWLLSVLQGHLLFPPRHNGQWPPTFYPRFYPLKRCCPILILEKNPEFPFSMLSAEQGR